MKRWLLPALALLCSCNLFHKKGSGENIIARAGDAYLYAADIEGLIPPGTKPSDSIEMIRNYANNWVRQALVLQKAELNLSADLTNFEKQLEDYRKSLIIHAYQEKVVAQYLDTTVTEADIEGYYQNNPTNFELKDNIVRVDYVVFSKKNPEVSKVKGWMQSDDAAKRQKLDEFCRKAAYQYHLNDSSWIILDDLEKVIPFSYASQELFLNAKKFIEIEDSSLVYFVKINDYKIKESISPLEFERTRIKSIILNMRKLDLLKKVEEETFNEALEKNKFEIFVQ